MPTVKTQGLTFRFGKVTALDNVNLDVPAGALYALLGPNGAGKTTLLQILMGMRRPTEGQVSVLGKDVTQLTAEDRSAIGYVAEGQNLPEWMTVNQLEAYLAPLYPTWDSKLAAELRDRFELGRSSKIKSLSRGQKMKAALLCALAPRPRLLILDEPFTGMDVMVKDELVGGLLESAGSEGWTILMCSHDISELEMLADWVGILGEGKLIVSEPTETLLERVKRVDVVSGNGAAVLPANIPAEWMSVERSGARVSMLVADSAETDTGAQLRRWFPEPASIDVRSASLREVFVAMARKSSESPRLVGVAS